MRIYYPLPDRTEAWVTSGPLQINGSLTADPGRALLAGDRRTGRPGPARGVAHRDRGQQPVAGAASAARRRPRRPPPPDGAPNLARLASSPGTIAGGPQRYCANTARSVTVSVRVTDTERIAERRPFVPTAGLVGLRQQADGRGGGADTWQATLRTDTDGIDTGGRPPLLRDRDRRQPEPRSARLPADGSRAITVADCANTGPTLASLKASPGTVFTNLRACANNTPVTTVSAVGDRRRRRRPA